MEDRITIGGRELTLTFDTAAFVDVERKFGSLERMYKRFDEDIMPVTAGMQLAAICATSGSCDRDKKGDEITFAWLVHHASPVEAQRIANIARMAVIRGMTTTETPFDDEDSDHPVDVGLEEAEAKKAKADA